MQTHAVLAQLDQRPALARALGEYRYAIRFVCGGQRFHAGAFQALDHVRNAAPDGVNAVHLAEAYIEAQDSNDKAEAERLDRAARFTTMQWDDPKHEVVVAGTTTLTIIKESGAVTEHQRHEAIEARRRYLNTFT